MAFFGGAGSAATRPVSRQSYFPPDDYVVIEGEYVYIGDDATAASATVPVPRQSYADFSQDDYVLVDGKYVHIGDQDKGETVTIFMDGEQKEFKVVTCQGTQGIFMDSGSSQYDSFMSLSMLKVQGALP